MKEIIIPEQEKELLAKYGFIPEVGQPKLYNNQVDEDTVASVDYRKVNGRRFARTKGEFVDDPDTIPILKVFKEARDKLQSLSTENVQKRPAGAPSNVAGKEETKLGTPDTLQSSKNDPEDKNKREASSGKLGQENTISQTKIAFSNGVQNPPALNSNKTVWDELAVAYEFDIVELFGNAGDGKSKFALKVAMDAIAQGKKIKYVDTERGLLKIEREKLGSGYQYISNLSGLMQYVKDIPKDIDLLIIDSVGYPVLTEWAKMGVNDRGNALTQIIAIKDLIKDWAINNNKIALVINQPDSDFGKAADYVNRPFGDKGQFVIKEVFRIERQKPTVTSKPMTKSLIKVFRSRYDPRDTVVATVEISGDGVKIY